MKETFKKHPRYKCNVSNLGNVIGIRGKIMIGNKKRYHRITIRDQNNIPCTVSVHRLVAELFIGPIEGFVINHKDGNKLNNNVNNLEICTIKYNIQHAFDNGLAHGQKGEDNGNSIITENEVIEIYNLIKQGYDNNHIGKEYNINFRTVSLIRNGDRWKHLFEKHMNEIIPSKNTKYSFITCCEVIDDILYTNMKNIEISKKYNIEPSLISRVRSKKTWKNIWSLHYRSATTIPQGSTSQVNGDGNTENPSLGL